MSTAKHTKDVPAPVHHLIGLRPQEQPMQLEYAMLQARIMSLRSQGQIDIVSSLLFHLDRMQKLIKAQRININNITAKIDSGVSPNAEIKRPPDE